MAPPQWMTQPALFLHAAGFLFWIGALPPLLILLAKDPEGVALPLARFSRIAPWAIAMILVSGIVLSAIQLGAHPQFWISAYGMILACKLALLFVALGLAAWNRYWLTRPALAREDEAIFRLRNSIKLEMLLLAGVLALAAAWRFAPPPRALADMGEVPLALHLRDARLSADLSLFPGRAGLNRLRLSLRDQKQQPVAPQEVAVTLSAPERGIEPIRRVLPLGDENLLHMQELLVPLAGAWDLELAVRLSRYELVRLKGPLEIPE
jgi:copper transport protein